MVLTNMWHQLQQLISDSTTENLEYRPEPYGPNSTITPADILTLLCAWFTSRPSFRQTKHFASPNTSTIVHETSELRYTWRESWYYRIWKTLYLIFTLYLQALKFIPGHFLSRDHVVRHPRRTGGTPPPNFCDFHSQSQGRCCYFRTALETLSAQIYAVGESDQPPVRKRILDILESEFDSGSTSNLFDTSGFDTIITTISWRQMPKIIIFCLNFACQLQTND